MTPSQHAILSFIRGYTLLHGESPTLQEIADRRGISKTTAHEFVSQLERKGAIRRIPWMTRSIEVVPDKSKRLAFPFAGEIR